MLNISYSISHFVPENSRKMQAPSSYLSSLGLAELSLVAASRLRSHCVLMFDFPLRVTRRPSQSGFSWHWAASDIMSHPYPGLGCVRDVVAPGMSMCVIMQTGSSIVITWSDFEQWESSRKAWPWNSRFWEGSRSSLDAMTRHSSSPVSTVQIADFCGEDGTLRSPLRLSISR